MTRHTPARCSSAEHQSSCMTRIGTATVILAIFPLLSLLSCGGGNGMSSSFMPPSQSPSPVAGLKQLSSDSFTNSQSQHATEVEPGMAASGSTLVTAFQVGRIYGGGAADIGFATSTDAGASWSNGLLPGITQFESGTYIAVSDPSVAYDQAHSVWIIASLAIASGTDIVVVSRSSDAHNWNNPITVSSTPDADKNWITCDNNSASPFF